MDDEIKIILISFTLCRYFREEWSEKKNNRVKFKQLTEIVILQWCLTYILLGAVPVVGAPAPLSTGVLLKSLTYRLLKLKAV